MILYANGCSLTWGDDLTDILNVFPNDRDTKEFKDKVTEIEQERPGDPTTYRNFDVVIGRDDEYRLKKSWPGILTDLLVLHGLHNDAAPGGSNTRIVRTSTDWIAANKYSNLFVVIGWTSPTRIELWNNDYNIHRQHLLNFTKFYTKDDVKFYNKFWQDNHNDYDKLDNFFHQVLLFQSFLKQNRIPYLFFDALPTVNNRNLDTKLFEHLDKLIDKRRYLNYNKNNGCFYAWAMDKKYKLGNRDHPLEDAHNDWAHILYNYINENNLLNAEENN